MTWICKKCERDYKTESAYRSHNCQEEIRYKRLKEKYNKKLSIFYQELLQARKSLKTIPHTVTQEQEVARKEVHQQYHKHRLDWEKAIHEKDRHISSYIEKLESCKQELISSEATIIQLQRDLEQQKTITQKLHDTFKNKEVEQHGIIQTKQSVIYDLQKTHSDLEMKALTGKEQYEQLYKKYQHDMTESKQCLAEELTKLKKVIEQIKQEHDIELQKQISKQKSDLSLKHLEEINLYKQQLKTQQTKHTDHINELQQVHLTSTKTIQELTAQELNKLNAKLRDTKEGYEKRLEDLGKEYETLKVQSSSQISHFSKQINTLEKQLKKSHDIEKGWNTKMEEIKGEYTSKIQELNNTYAIQIQNLENQHETRLQQKLAENQQFLETGFEKLLGERTNQYLDKLNSQTELVNTQKIQYENTIKSLNSQMDRVTKDSIHTLNTLQSQYDQSLVHARTLKDKIDELHRVNKNIQEDNKVLRQNNASSQKTIQTLQTEIQELQTKISQIRNQIELVKKRESSLISQVDAKESQISTLQKTLDTVKITIHEQYREKLKTQTDTHVRELQFIQGKYDTLKQEHELLSKLNKDNELTIGILNTKHGTEVSRLKEILTEKGINTDEKDKQLSQLQLQYNTLSEQSRLTIKYLQEQLDKSTKDFNEKLEKYTNNETHYNTLLTKMRKEHSQQLSELKEQNLLQINQLKLKATASQASLTERQKQVESLQTEMVKLSTEIKSVQYDYQQKIKEIDKRQKQLDLQEEKIRNAPPKLLDPSIKESRDRLMTDLRTSRHEAQTLIDKVKDLENVKERNTELQGRIRELETLMTQKINKI